LPTKLDVVVPCEVLVAVEVAEVVEAGIAASRISTIFGGGRFSIVLVDSCVEVACVVDADSGLGGVVVLIAGVVVAAGARGGGSVISGVEEGTITGSGSVGVVVGVSTGGGGVTGGVLVGVVVGVIGTGVGGRVTGRCTCCIGVWSSVEVEAASSMYAELFLEKLPKGACAERSCVRAFSGEFHPLPSTAFGKTCTCFTS